MSPIRVVRGFICRARARAQQSALLQEGDPGEIYREEWCDSLRGPNGFYVKCFRYFHTRLPSELRAHRVYFAAGRRGFGEEAFHVMWFLIFREFRPRQFLEIGVYRGQTLSLAALLQRTFGYAVDVVGVSPFSSAGDSVSKYMKGVDYFEDTLQNFARFFLPKPRLLKAFSTESVAREFIRSRTWNCVYIDGNHDYEIARQDWDICSLSTNQGDIIVLDDAGLTTSFRPPAFATGGHAGPSRLAQEIDRAEFQEILQVGHNRVFQKIA